MPILTLMPAMKPTATPSSAEWASVSPNYAMRRQTTNTPTAPMIMAMPTPAIMANSRKSGMVVIVVVGIDGLGVTVFAE